MNGGKGWWTGTGLVAGRSLGEGVRSKTVRVTTLIMLIAGLAFVLVPGLLGKGTQTYTLASIGQPAATVRAGVQAASTASGFHVKFLAVASDPAVKQAVRRGDATVGLGATRMYVRSDAPGTFTVLVAQAVVADARMRVLHDAGLTPSQISALSSVAPPKQETVGPVWDAGRASVGFVVGIVLYLAIMLSGNMLATSVAVEKSTRIAEVLLAMLRPSQILVGNVLGKGLQTLVQLLVLAVPILAAMAGTNRLDLPRAAATDIGLGIAWFVIGYFMYAFLFAAAASTVDKVTEVATAITPVTMLLVVGYVGALVAVPQSPTSPLSVGISLFPLTAPLAMPVRWSAGLVPMWQLGLSLLLSVAAAALLAWFGAALYRRALVITGRRVKLREVLPGSSENGHPQS